jgi:hypothetical protein
MKRLFLALALLAVPAAQAHHSASAYDRTQNLTVAGTVKEFRWANPRTWLYVLVPDGKGSSDLWSFEGGSVSVLSRNGSNGGGFIKVIFDDGSSHHVGVV